MSQVVEQLAELTAFRDRDLVDSTLAVALRDLLRPAEVAIHRCIGDETDRRWLTRARLGLHDVAAAADPLWRELHELPALDSAPLRLQALQGQAPVAQGGPPWLTVYPLTTDRDALGVLELRTDAPLDADAHRLVAAILRIYRNFQSLLDSSERDTLTGLFNRKTFDEAFYKLAAAGAAAAGDGAVEPVGPERRAPVAVQAHYIGVIDIDHFKRVNDQHGHLIGDEVLLLLSRLMRSVFRFHDRLYRFGGEEFVVLMRCGSDADASRAFERLRAGVLAYPFPQVGRITVSIGFTALKAGDTPSSAFERADRAVYWAKSHGRNQVCNHAALLAAGLLADETKVGDVELF